MNNIFNSTKFKNKNQLKLFELFLLNLELNNLNKARRAISILIRQGLSYHLLYEILDFVDLIDDDDLLNILKLLVIKQNNVHLLKYYLYSLIKHNKLGESFLYLEFYIYSQPFTDDDQLQRLHNKLLLTQQ